MVVVVVVGVYVVVDDDGPTSMMSLDLVSNKSPYPD